MKNVKLAEIRSRIAMQLEESFDYLSDFAMFLNLDASPWRTPELRVGRVWAEASTLRRVNRVSPFVLFSQGTAYIYVTFGDAEHENFYESDYVCDWKERFLSGKGCIGTFTGFCQSLRFLIRDLLLSSFDPSITIDSEDRCVRVGSFGLTGEDLLKEASGMWLPLRSDIFQDRMSAVRALENNFDKHIDDYAIMRYVEWVSFKATGCRLPGHLAAYIVAQYLVTEKTPNFLYNILSEVGNTKASWNNAFPKGYLRNWLDDIKFTNLDSIMYTCCETHHGVHDVEAWYRSILSILNVDPAEVLDYEC